MNSPYGSDQGLTLRVYSSGECGIQRLDLSVAWKESLGRFGVRYWQGLAMYCMAVVGCLQLSAYRAFDRGGECPECWQRIAWLNETRHLPHCSRDDAGVYIATKDHWMLDCPGSPIHNTNPTLVFAWERRRAIVCLDRPSYVDLCNRSHSHVYLRPWCLEIHRSAVSSITWRRGPTVCKLCPYTSGRTHPHPETDKKGEPQSGILRLFSVS